MTITCTSPTTYHIPDEEIVSLLVKAGMVITGKTIEPEQTVSREEYAKMNGMNRDTVSRLCKAGKLKHKRIGLKLRIYVNQGESKQQTINQPSLKKVG